MTINKRKKITRMRGSHTHGGGAMKKRRGAGNRGGRGLAGTGKRGDAKKPSHWKNTEYFGKKGFHSITRKKVDSINIKDINQKIAGWLEKGIAEKTGSEIILDLKKIGYDKLLGVGTPDYKLEIHALQVSKKAKEKIEGAGGKVVLPKTE